MGNISNQLLYRVLSWVASMVRKRVIFHDHIYGYIWNGCVRNVKDNSLIVHPKIDTFVTFFPFSFLFCWLPIEKFCWNFSCQIYFSLAVGTKMVAAWSTVMFWEVFTHPRWCKLPLKLRLDVMWGDSGATLSVLANMFSWYWFENL